MEKELHPKVQKLLDKSKQIKGKTLTGSSPDQVEIYSFKNQLGTKETTPISSYSSPKA